MKHSGLAAGFALAAVFALGGIGYVADQRTSLHHPVNGSSNPKTKLKIGDRDGGGVYVGASATDGRPLHAALADELEYLTFDEAVAAVEKIRSQPGRGNAHIPTPEELNVNLYQNRLTGALKGTFTIRGGFPAGCYRSSEPHSNYSALVQCFDDGSQSYYDGINPLPVRLVW